MYIKLSNKVKEVFMYDPDFSTMRETIPKQSYEPGVVLNIIHDLEEADCFLDIGSLYGYYCLYLSMYNDKLPFFAFEPNPYFYEIIKYNIKLNEIENISTINYGLSNCSENVYINEKCINGSIVELDNIDSHIDIDIPLRSKKNTINFPTTKSYMHWLYMNIKSKIKNKKNVSIYPVKLIRIDDWLKFKNFKNIVTKIDIHGYEIQALKGAIESLNKSLFKSIYVEIHSKKFLVNSNYKELYHLINNGRYKIFEIVNYRRSDFEVKLLSEYDLKKFCNYENWNFKHKIEMRMLKLVRI